MTGRVVVIGDALIDELRDDGGVREFVGGAAVNVAVGVVRQGVPATLIAMVGDDEAGEWIRSYLADYGVELIASPSEYGTARAISTRIGGADPDYTFNEAAQRRRIRYGADEHAAVAEAELVAISCVAFDDTEQTRELAETLSSGAADYAIDANPRSGMLRERDEFIRGFESLVPAATIVKLGEDDVDLLYGEPLDAVRARMIDLGAGAALATYGEAGAAIEVGESVLTSPAARMPGEIVDTLGAGDATFAAVLARLVDAMPTDAAGWQHALNHAMAVAAATCRFSGGLLRLPTALEQTGAAGLGS